MDPHTVGGLTGRTAHSGHIRHENYEFTAIGGPRPHSPSAASQTIAPRIWTVWSTVDTLSELPLVVASQSPYIGRPMPSLITNHGQVFRPGSQKTMAHDEPAQGMASAGHILLGNHEVIRTNGSAPINNFYPV
jgi:hypothetical protein